MLRSKKSKAIVFSIILAIILSLTSILTYNLMKDSVQKLIVSNIDELAKHDMQSIQGYVSDKIDSVQSVVDKVVYEAPDNISDVLSILRRDVKTSSFTKFGLIDENGQLYSDSRGVLPAEKNTFLEYFDGSCGKKFARRYDGMEHDDELVMKYLIYGIDFSDTPIEIAGVKFIGAVGLNRLAEINSILRISLFDGKGYSCVMNRDGFYIVPPDSNTNPDDLPNFFEMIRGRKFTSGIDIADVKIKTMKREEFTFTTKDSSGMERFISIKPIENSNWCFINSIDTYVFKTYTNVFLKITFGIIIFLMLVLIGGFWLIYFSEKRLENLYTTTVKGVFNRKYYNEKLTGKNVKSFIILDLDHLKHINDGSGHLAGDQAIAASAEVIYKRIGSFGDVVRYGEDEFIVAYKQNINEDEFMGQINNILKDIRAKKLEQFPDIKLSLSIGGYYGEGTIDELMLRADELLYKAKKSRNCAVTNLDKSEEETDKTE